MKLYNGKVDKIAADMFEDIFVRGARVTTRNATTQRLINLSATFTSTPLIGVRKTAWKSALREMEWFLSGSSNVKDLHKSVHPWWKPWADKSGVVQNNYSKQLRRANGSDAKGTLIELDQVSHMINALQNHPNSRRNILTTWNSAEMAHADTPITNCHLTMLQAFVNPETNGLQLSAYQRSADMVLGVPHNWIQLWALGIWLAHKSGRDLESVTWIGGDCHVYPDHMDVVSKIVDTNIAGIKTPNLVYSPTSEEFVASDFSLDGDYSPLINTKLNMTV